MNHFPQIHNRINPWNFFTTSIIVIIMIIALVILMVVDIRFGWLLITVVVTYTALLVIGSIRTCSGFYLEAFCRVNTLEKTVFLTFDDGPDPANTQEILAILDMHDIQATFFLIGERAERHKEIVKEIHRKGHTIGIHSYSHAFFFDLYGRKKMEQDLLRCEQVIFEITGERPVMFRPPYGVTNPVLAKVVRKLGYKVIGWSLRSFDTKIKDEEKLADRVIKGLHPGAIVLLHDDREITAKVLERIILMIKNEGFRFAGLDEIA